jgi:hypothetical protein
MKKILTIITIIFLVGPLTASAVMQSGNYKIDADSLNTGGGFSSSENFKVGDNLGEVINGEGASTSYRVKDGLQYMIDSYLTLTLDSNSQDLGSITYGTPATGQTVATVTTDAWSGYAINVSKNHAMLHTNGTLTIPDQAGTLTTPVLWQAPNNVGFGFTVLSGTEVETKWGESPNYKYAGFPDLSTTAHQKSGFQSGADETTFGYRVDIPDNQGAGTYSSTITYTAVTQL